MLSVEKSAELVGVVRDQVRDGADVDDLLRERGVNPDTLGVLRAIAGLTWGGQAIAMVDASVLAGVALGQAALQEQPEAEDQTAEV